MDFRLSPEQQLLRDSARRCIAAHHDFEHRAARAAAPSSRGWDEFAALGWLAMLAPEEAGGLGAGLPDLTLLCEELGRGLVLDRFIGGAVLPMRLLAACPAGAVRTILLEDLAAGRHRAAVAVLEPGRRWRSDPLLRASPVGNDSWTLTGRKVLVDGGATADRLIVAALAPSGTNLFVVDALAPGVRRRIYPLIDDTAAADFDFEGAAAIGLAVGAGVQGIVDDALDDAALCLCADVLGAMDRAIELARDFLKVRQQFGKPLAEFQALQHAMAEMYIESDGARSMVYRALAHAEAAGPDRPHAIAACKVKVLAAGKAVAGMAVHLHGGMGVSCELAVGHLLRRITVAERMYGDAEFHLARLL